MVYGPNDSNGHMSKPAVNLVPAQWIPKDHSLYSDSENNKISMDKSVN